MAGKDRAGEGAGGASHLALATTPDRAGSFGPGPYTSIIDGYDVDCGAAAPGQTRVFLDMYHPGHREAAAVPGFTILPPE